MVKPEQLMFFVVVVFFLFFFTHTESLGRRLKLFAIQ